jgi:hypothetical protein
MPNTALDWLVDVGESLAEWNEETTTTLLVTSTAVEHTVTFCAFGEAHAHATGTIKLDPAKAEANPGDPFAGRQWISVEHAARRVLASVVKSHGHLFNDDQVKAMSEAAELPEPEPRRPSPIYFTREELDALADAVGALGERMEAIDPDEEHHGEGPEYDNDPYAHSWAALDEGEAMLAQIRNRHPDQFKEGG